jgi:hypothetical protein
MPLRLSEVCEAVATEALSRAAHGEVRRYKWDTHTHRHRPKKTMFRLKSSRLSSSESGAGRSTKGVLAPRTCECMYVCVSVYVHFLCVTFCLLSIGCCAEWRDHTTDRVMSRAPAQEAGGRHKCAGARSLRRAEGSRRYVRDQLYPSKPVEVVQTARDGTAQACGRCALRMGCVCPQR